MDPLEEAPGRVHLVRVTQIRASLAGGRNAKTANIGVVPPLSLAKRLKLSTDRKGLHRPDVGEAHGGHLQ